MMPGSALLSVRIIILFDIIYIEFIYGIFVIILQLNFNALDVVRTEQDLFTKNKLYIETYF